MMTRRPLPSFVIKICGITNEDDARNAIEAGANALGFNFYAKSPRFVTAAIAAGIVSAVPGNYLKVGVFVNADADEISHHGSYVPLDVVQLHGYAPQHEFSGQTWRAGFITALKKQGERDFDAYLLDAATEQYGGSGRSFDWGLAAGFPHRAIIAGGLDHSNVGEAIRITSAWGVDACSRLETSPGKKDRDRVRKFVQAAIAARNRCMQETTS